MIGPGWARVPGHETGVCPDCDGFLVLYVNHDQRRYRFEVEHDDTCPLLAQLRSPA